MTRLGLSSAAVIVVGCLLVSGCGGGIPGNVVVQIGGQSITKATFHHWLSVAAASSTQTAAGDTGSKPVVPEPPNYTACISNRRLAESKASKGQKAKTPAQLKAHCKRQYEALQHEVLGFLINSDWTIGEANALGVNVTAAEVERQFETIKKQNFRKEPEFRKFLANSGETVADLLLKVKVNMLSQKIRQTSKSELKPITRAQIEEYYNANKERFDSPESRDVELIRTKTRLQAEQAKQELQAGKSFTTVAKARSILSSNKANGGLVRLVKVQNAPLSRLVFAAKPNVLGGPVGSAAGYYNVFEVRAIHAAVHQTLAQAQAQIKQQITAQQHKTAGTFLENFQKKWIAKTDCRPEYVIERCKQYKPAKAPATATPPVTPQTSSASTAAPSTPRSTPSTSASASKSTQSTLKEMTVSSPAFPKGGLIPARYTCDGANISPPLQWSNIPAHTAEMVLVVSEQAAGPQSAVRWAVGNISPGITTLKAGSTPRGAVVGRDPAGKATWGGICPAKGNPHNIIFLLYALKEKLALANGFDPHAVQKQLAGNIIGGAVTFGSYGRP